MVVLSMHKEVVPKVSVVIPAYNAMTYLPLTLASVLAQSFNDFEVIIVNDGSADHIESWFDRVVHDPRVKLVSQSNKGLSGARNTGIRHAQGRYIAFLDADDVWEPEKLEKQVHVLDLDEHVGLVYTWVAYIDEQGLPTGRIQKNDAEGMIWPALVQKNVVECGSVALVRRECFDAAGFFNEDLRAVEDLDMWLRIAEFYEFRVIKEPLVYYRQHTASLSRQWSIMETSFRQVLDQAFASASPDQLKLKARSYALAYLCVAWKPIQHECRDYGESMRLLVRAIRYDAAIMFTSNFWRLCLALICIRCLGNAGYLRFVSVMYAFRSKVFGKRTRTLAAMLIPKMFDVSELTLDTH